MPFQGEIHTLITQHRAKCPMLGGGAPSGRIQLLKNRIFGILLICHAI